MELTLDVRGVIEAVTRSFREAVTTISESAPPGF